MKDLKDFMAVVAWAALISLIVAALIAVISLDDSESWSELPDGCLLRTEVARTWLFDSETTVTIWCQEVP